MDKIEGLIGRSGFLGSDYKAKAEDIPKTIGIRMQIWKEYPKSKGLVLEEVYIHTNVEHGPKDSQFDVLIENIPAVQINEDKIQILNKYEDEHIDMIHTYAVARLTLTMYQRLLKRKIVWSWNQKGSNIPLKVYPHNNKEAMKHANFNKINRSLNFGWKDHEKRIYSCKSLDVVVHETGHAILDSLKPFWEIKRDFVKPQSFIEQHSIIESFADLSVIFFTLSLFDMVEQILVISKGNLKRDTQLSKLMEYFDYESYRNAYNTLKMNDEIIQSGRGHMMSQVFTGAVYYTLADYFTYKRNARFENDALVLYNVSQFIAKIYLKAIERSPDNGPRISDIAQNMIEVAIQESDFILAYILFKQFEFREIFVKKIS
ncbi:hypothetical protein [Chondrinema litorale]|uniref:hypothetical protein n=1 Tax=Chondrinema litorale TaxID=2994555 RepID=UPI0025427E97|nr:hypothetical protein [Chondrinema litorale]UZS00208.1 hypothetical protein OQ292_40520 [Chondrinema litorale]